MLVCSLYLSSLTSGTFSAPNETMKLQPFGERIITSIKLRYRKRDLECAVYLAYLRVNQA